MCVCIYIYIYTHSLLVLCLFEEAEEAADRSSEGFLGAPEKRGDLPLCLGESHP